MAGAKRKGTCLGRVISAQHPAVPWKRLMPHSGHRLLEKLALSMWTLACCEMQHAANRTVAKMVLQCPIGSVVPV